MKDFLKYFFIDTVVSFLFTLFLFFLLKNFEIKKDILNLILVFSYLLIFVFSFTMSIFIYSLKSKIDYLKFQIEKLNKYDEITDIFKREFLLETLKKYFELSKNKNYPLTIMILDVDDFQNINKTFGFETGNKILKQIANLLKNYVCDMDILGKYDSDEFLIAMFTYKEEMESLAKEIKNKIDNFVFENNIRLSVSIGITQRKIDDDFLDFLTRAQEAVLLAKKKGGDTVNVLEHFLLI